MNGEGGKRARSSAAAVPLMLAGLALLLYAAAPLAHRAHDHKASSPRPRMCPLLAGRSAQISCPGTGRPAKCAWPRFTSSACSSCRAPTVCSRYCGSAGSSRYSPPLPPQHPVLLAPSSLPSAAEGGRRLEPKPERPVLHAPQPTGARLARRQACPLIFRSLVRHMQPVVAQIALIRSRLTAWRQTGRRMRGRMPWKG